MSQSQIRSIIESRLAAWAAARVPALPVLWENARVDTEPGGDHLRAYLLPATTRSPFLAGDGRSYRGIFQVSIFCAPGSGPKKAEAISAEMDALFPCYALLTNGVLTVQVMTPVSVSPAQSEPGWFMAAASFNYRCEAEVSV